MINNNGLIFTITAAGRELRSHATENGTAFPAFTGFVVDSAKTQDINAPVLEALYSSSSPSELVKKRIDATAFGIHILIPAHFAGWVRGLALMCGQVVYAYARFDPENGGMYKPVGTAIRQLLILAEDGRGAVDFTYSVVDISELKDYLISSSGNAILLGVIKALEQIIRVDFNTGRVKFCSSNDPEISIDFKMGELIADLAGCQFLDNEGYLNIYNSLSENYDFNLTDLIINKIE